jgi:hypothetical protein
MNIDDLYRSSPGVARPISRNRAITGIMTCCGAADELEFQGCKHCPNHSGPCEHLRFEQFCCNQDAQQEAKDETAKD